MTAWKVIRKDGSISYDVRPADVTMRDGSTPPSIPHWFMVTEGGIVIRPRRESVYPGGFPR